HGPVLDAPVRVADRVPISEVGAVEERHPALGVGLRAAAAAGAEQGERKRQKGRTAATAERIEHRPYRCRDSIHARPPRSVHKSLDYVYDRAGIIEEPVPEWRPAAPSSARTGCWAAKISN